MIDKLREYYQDAFIFCDTPNDDSCKWYISDNGTIFGIKKDVLSMKEIELLSVFFTPYGHLPTEMNELERDWYNTIFNSGGYTRKLKVPECFTIIQYSLTEHIQDTVIFKDAVKGLLPPQVTLIWKDMYNGIIILEDEPNLYALNQLIETISSDFYTNITLFIGMVRKSQQQNSIYSAYQWEHDCFEMIQKKLGRKNVAFSFYDALPFIILSETSQQSRDRIVGTISNLDEVDHELFKTIKVFIECNSNSTMAAKKLFIHRNSLQYRIDKFIEKTGVNVKEFQGAMIAYWAILCKEFDGN